MANYKTPGVYVEEKDAFGASVTQIETAIPVFIGYTQKRIDKHGRSLEAVAGNACAPIKIKNILEYHQIFGEPKHMGFTVHVSADEQNPQIISIAETKDALNYTLYYNLKYYFENGGGPCYVISIGQFPDKKNGMKKADFERGIEVADSEDEITMYLLPEATHLAKKDYYSLVSKMLASCQTTQDRFAIIDVLDTAANQEKAKRVGEKNVFASSIEEDSMDFRNNVTSDALDRGAAYYPYLHTSLSYIFNDVEVEVVKDGAEEGQATKTLEEFGAPAGSKSYREGNATIIQYAGELPNVVAAPGDVEGIVIETTEDTATLKWKTGLTIDQFKAAWLALMPKDRKGFSVQLGRLTDAVLANAAIEFVDNASNSKVYNMIQDRLRERTVILPPSSAIAGCYVRTDNSRGIWNAPANIGVQSTLAPMRKVDKLIQQNLNVCGISGKSINCIRSFPGKGILVWGARTLAGNDNNWRYINVRRLFLAVEENCKKATEFMVFEPNTAVTWVKVKAMIQSYFNSLYNEGALVGASPDQAYYVKVGLGETMTPTDILEGRMLVEIGICPSRPAEFIVLTFTQILQES